MKKYRCSRKNRYKRKRAESNYKQKRNFNFKKSNSTKMMKSLAAGAALASATMARVYWPPIITDHDYGNKVD